MNTVEQHLRDYENLLLRRIRSEVHDSPPAVQALCERKLADARKRLADHIEIVTRFHSHSQYEPRTTGLP